MKKNIFGKKRPRKIPTVGDLVTAKTGQQLEKIANDARKEEKNPVEQKKGTQKTLREEIIEALGETEIKLPTEKTDLPQESFDGVVKRQNGKNVKVVGQPFEWGNLCGRPTVIKPQSPKFIEADVTVVCIEITDSIEKISKWIDASMRMYITKFYKFIFFNNKVYSTEIELKSSISKEEILELVKKQKEILTTSPEDNILLYDAIDEAFSLSKEYDFFDKRKITIEKTYFKINSIRYLFVISGKEKGSGITKLELQEMISKVRSKETDIHVVLTKSENIGEIVSLGFRSIKSY